MATNPVLFKYGTTAELKKIALSPGTFYYDTTTHCLKVAWTVNGKTTLQNVLSDSSQINYFTGVISSDSKYGSAYAKMKQTSLILENMSDNSASRLGWADNSGNVDSISFQPFGLVKMRGNTWLNKTLAQEAPQITMSETNKTVWIKDNHIIVQDLYGNKGLTMDYISDGIPKVTIPKLTVTTLTVKNINWSSLEERIELNQIITTPGNDSSDGAKYLWLDNNVIQGSRKYKDSNSKSEYSYAKYDLLINPHGGSVALGTGSTITGSKDYSFAIGSKAKAYEVYINGTELSSFILNTVNGGNAITLAHGTNAGEILQASANIAYIKNSYDDEKCAKRYSISPNSTRGQTASTLPVYRQMMYVANKKLYTDEVRRIGNFYLSSTSDYDFNGKSSAIFETPALFDYPITIMNKSSTNGNSYMFIDSIATMSTTGIVPTNYSGIYFRTLNHITNSAITNNQMMVTGAIEFRPQYIYKNGASLKSQGGNLQLKSSGQINILGGEDINQVFNTILEKEGNTNTDDEVSIFSDSYVNLTIGAEKFGDITDIINNEKYTTNNYSVIDASVIKSSPVFKSGDTKFNLLGMTLRAGSTNYTDLVVIPTAFVPYRSGHRLAVNGLGFIGTSDIRWGYGYFNNLNTNKLNVNTSASIVGLSSANPKFTGTVNASNINGDYLQLTGNSSTEHLNLIHKYTNSSDNQGDAYIKIKNTSDDSYPSEYIHGYRKKNGTNYTNYLTLSAHNADGIDNYFRISITNGNSSAAKAKYELNYPKALMIALLPKTIGSSVKPIYWNATTSTFETTTDLQADKNFLSYREQTTNSTTTKKSVDLGKSSFLCFRQLTAQNNKNEQKLLHLAHIKNAWYIDSSDSTTTKRYDSNSNGKFNTNQHSYLEALACCSTYSDSEYSQSNRFVGTRIRLHSSNNGSNGYLDIMTKDGIKLRQYNASYYSSTDKEWKTGSATRPIITAESGLTVISGTDIRFQTTSSDMALCVSASDNTVKAAQTDQDTGFAIKFLDYHGRNMGNIFAEQIATTVGNGRVNNLSSINYERISELDQSIADAKDKYNDCVAKKKTADSNKTKADANKDTTASEQYKAESNYYADLKKYWNNQIQAYQKEKNALVADDSTDLPTKNANGSNMYTSIDLRPTLGGIAGGAFKIYSHFKYQDKTGKYLSSSNCKLQAQTKEQNGYVFAENLYSVPNPANFRVAINAAVLSDSRSKNFQGFMEADEANHILSEIPVINFYYKKDEDSNSKVLHNGVFAQDVKTVLKKYGYGNRDYLYYRDSSGAYEYDAVGLEDDEDCRYGIEYQNFVPVLWQGWKNHDSEINAIKTENEQLKNEIEELKTQLAEIIKIVKG